ncbi:unnamed protein product [Cylicostephanus goldi]|uniref:Uncharacterized protein n=1 Tax=Cylicostephanus goldi TaxID=71465 RepID=A0A3P6SIA2_CYLGO|nr:unnamed protein product [Cylicostephanus goldi]
MLRKRDGLEKLGNLSSSIDTTPTKVRRKAINIEPRKSPEEGQGIVLCGVDKLYGAVEPPDVRGVAWRPPVVHGAIGETSVMPTMSVKKRKASNDLTADDEEIRFICEGFAP